MTSLFAYAKCNRLPVRSPVRKTKLLLMKIWPHYYQTNRSATVLSGLTEAQGRQWRQLGHWLRLWNCRQPRPPPEAAHYRRITTDRHRDRGYAPWAPRPTFSPAFRWPIIILRRKSLGPNHGKFDLVFWGVLERSRQVILSSALTLSLASRRQHTLSKTCDRRKWSLSFTAAVTCFGIPDK